jgi:hypothetical protein
MDMEDEIRAALGRWSTPQLVAMLRNLELGDGWEPWSPSSWPLLSDALAGWDMSGTFATQTDDPYVGPEGDRLRRPFAGNAAEDMLCLLEATGWPSLPEHHF